MNAIANNDVMDDKVKEGLEKHRADVKQHLASGNVAAITYSYDCMVSTGAAAGGFLNVDFKKNGKLIAQFKGGYAGGVGGYVGWGTAWFDKPVEGLIGQTAAFTVELVGILGGTAHVQITNVNNFIGNCSTGGVGIGAGLGVGAGKFNA